MKNDLRACLLVSLLAVSHEVKGMSDLELSIAIIS